MRRQTNEDEIEVFESLGLGRKAAEAAAGGRDGAISLREPGTVRFSETSRESDPQIAWLPDIELEDGTVINLREAAVREQGLSETKVSLRKKKKMPCEHCHGEGEDKDGEECTVCHGSGKSPYRESSDSPSRGDVKLFESLGMNRAAATAMARGR